MRQSLAQLCMGCLLLGVLVPISHGFPTIGVLTQSSQYFIEQAYIDYLQASGALVVPLKHDMAGGDLSDMLLNLNGVLIPSGSYNISGTPMRTLYSGFLTQLNQTRTTRLLPVSSAWCSWRPRHMQQATTSRFWYTCVLSLPLSLSLTRVAGAGQRHERAAACVINRPAS